MLCKGTIGLPHITLCTTYDPPLKALGITHVDNQNVAWLSKKKKKIPQHLAWLSKKNATATEHIQYLT